VVTHRGITVASGLAAWLLDWSADPAAILAAGCTPAIDHQRHFGRDVVGVREHQGRLVAVIAVDVPVEIVGAGLCQFDVRLDGIDIVSARTRHVSEAADPSTERTVDDSPAGGRERRTWLVLGMDPQHNVAAMVARDSVASALAAATKRLAYDLDGRRCAARPLTRDEFAEVDCAVLAGLQPTWSRPG
jgi:type VII secretion protein EccE